MGRLAGKTAFISGGARGLGAEMARLLHGEGANVMVTDVLEEEGHALVNDHENMTFMAHDVLQEDQWVATIAATKEAYGGLDVLVNNAGIAHNANTTAADQSSEPRRSLLTSFFFLLPVRVERVRARNMTASEGRQS